MIRVINNFQIVEEKFGKFADEILINQNKILSIEMLSKEIQLKFEDVEKKFNENDKNDEILTNNNGKIIEVIKTLFGNSTLNKPVLKNEVQFSSKLDVKTIESKVKKTEEDEEDKEGNKEKEGNNLKRLSMINDIKLSKYFDKI